jgi:Tol biopolymer transport system component
VIVAGCGTEPTPPAATDEDLGPQWATDRALIAYLHTSASLNGPQPTGLYVLDTLSRTTQLVLPGIANGYDWIPGTDTLVVAVGGVISVVTRAGAVVPIASVGEAFNCDVSPDGKTIAYDGAAGTKSAMYSLDRTTGVVTNVTPDSMLYQSPEWSPSGEQLAVIGGSPHAYGLFLVLRTGEPRRLLRSGQDMGAPAWSPDARQVSWYEFSVGIRKLFTMDTVLAVPMARAPCRSGGSWSPDGHLIVFDSETTAGSRLFLLDVATGSVRQLGK